MGWEKVPSPDRGDLIGLETGVAVAAVESPVSLHVVVAVASHTRLMNKDRSRSDRQRSRPMGGKRHGEVSCVCELRPASPQSISVPTDRTGQLGRVQGFAFHPRDQTQR